MRHRRFAAARAGLHAGRGVDRAAGPGRRRRRGPPASAFNKVGAIYAPYYRQANGSAFVEASAEGDAAIAAAYQDVRAAFQEFLRRRGTTPPFLLAGHSQGAVQGARLLVEEIAPTPRDPHPGRRLPGRHLAHRRHADPRRAQRACLRQPHPDRLCGGVQRAQPRICLRRHGPAPADRERGGPGDLRQPGHLDRRRWRD